MLRAVARLGLVLALVSPAPFVAGCGGASQKSAQSLPKPGSMPEFGDWTGVYYNPTYGYLHLVSDGSALSGKWRTTAGDKWGAMHGKVNGNLFVFDWEEHTIGMVGPTATSTGHGFFQYKTGEQDHIDGEWGIGDDYRGVPWSAVKQRRMNPDPDSVMPDETQRAHGDSWDQEKKMKKKSEGDDSSNSSDEWK